MSFIKYLRAAGLLSVTISTTAFCQLDPLSNQYLSNQSMINPAYVGVHDVATAMISSRGQWIGIDDAPWTHLFSASSSITEQMGVGLLMINDTYGINNNWEGILSYSYKVQWYENSLSFGVQGGIAKHSIDYSKLDLEIADDPNVPMVDASFSVNNFGTGLFFMNKNYYLGLSVPRMLEVNLADENARKIKYKRHYYLSAGYVFDHLEFIKIKPSVLVKTVQRESISIDLNGQIIINDTVWLGVMLRNLDAVGFNFQYHENGMRLGYAYELSFGPLASASYGVHELMFSFDAAILKRHRVPTRYF